MITVKQRLQTFTCEKATIFPLQNKCKTEKYFDLNCHHHQKAKE